MELPAEAVLCNHPLLFGTVSPTCPDHRGGSGTEARNHPLLFGTVSPTSLTVLEETEEVVVTTPYCSGLSLLLGEAVDVAVLDNL